MSEILTTFFNLDIARQVFPFLLEGLLTTFKLSLLIIPLGLAGGLLLALLHTQSHYRAVRILVNCYVDFFRSFPQLVLLIFVSFATPFLGLDLPPILSLAISFTLSTSAYYCEIFRAGIGSIPPAQTEAARSTGMSAAQTLAHVVLPQAVRNVTPDLLGNSLEIVKGTSIASVLGMSELLHNAQSAQSVLFSPTPLMLAALIYLLLLWPAVRLVSNLEAAMRLRSRH
ncbi:MAG: polar amino acid ABC transporter permease [Candidatus Dactylopiibacterium carminicum]|uniref:Amino acid ABC transporter permease n=1 Tax=Candidatus Dactylopiibacterium carminicum TaxID=857335 RepID=A0A272ES14_9RHOO|nr:amino acid ABC transporter permease [Candidatus Dactylopiibacterium carminicum]KAF7598918.1 amino acid ABC transporter permease [Candidatus Dactylopiibacterium carminicum]PAS92894.1 MAG: polar amino acid ABC transporter permease [Candidatus Dactylopiibacterium carminicum]PAS96472.1 MAG: polar amino acid ABC transporter permease [Candidatus Dactylopiibacterium carminicum]PAS98935.1 MAG: polar amino acid ABC transporter permease [Candidatus Dactylopiibacterium carminicum]